MNDYRFSQKMLHLDDKMPSFLLYMPFYNVFLTSGVAFFYIIISNVTISPVKEAGASLCVYTHLGIFYLNN